MKLPELKSQYIWATIMILCYVIPGIFPLGTPFPMSTTTEQIYQLLQDQPEDSIVVIGGSGVFAFDLESSAGTIPALRIMAQKHIKIVNFPLATEAVALEKYLIDGSRIETKYGGTYEYGVDWIQLPYTAGGASALVSFLEDIPKTCPTDVFGTPLSELPLGQRLHNSDDIALWICPHWAFPVIVQYVTGEKGIPSISFAQSAAYTTYSPYMMTYPDKVFMTNGFLGGAQMEALVGMKGLGHAVIDGNQVFSLVFLFFVILGNLTWIVNRQEEND